MRVWLWPHTSFGTSVEKLDDMARRQLAWYGDIGVNSLIPYGELDEEKFEVFDHALVNGLGKKTFFWQIRPDSWGTVTLQGFEDGLKEFGGKVVGVEQLPKGAPDYSAVINKALAAKPDAFITNMFGGDAVACIKTAYDMGLHKTSLLVNGWTAYEVAQGIPAEAAAELYALTYYYYDIGGFNKDLGMRGKALSEDHMKKYAVFSEL